MLLPDAVKEAIEVLRTRPHNTEAEECLAAFVLNQLGENGKRAAFRAAVAIRYEGSQDLQPKRKTVLALCHDGVLLCRRF